MPSTRALLLRRRVKPASSRGGLAHFELAGGQVSVAVRHRSVDELWYFVAGEGEMWLHDSQRSTTVPVSAGMSISIPVGTSFQFRATGDEALAAIGATVPPWPGDGEAIHVPDGAWQPTVAPGAGLASS